MEIVRLLETRFENAIRQALPETPLPDDLLIRPSQNPDFGDYQANFAMPLGKKLGKPPREVAAAVVAQLQIDDLCEPPEIAGPGFINLRMKQKFLTDCLATMVHDERLGVSQPSKPLTIVIDYSSPNCAKPMHVGHIRSTVIGDALCKILRFLGHRVISDNHIGDWGTQFGMILYGYKNFLDAQAYTTSPVTELGRLYKYVRKLIDTQSAITRFESGELTKKIAGAETNVAALTAALATAEAGNDKKEKTKAAKTLKKATADLTELRADAAKLESLVTAAQADPKLTQDLNAHPGMNARVLAETAKLHAGDAENRQLWNEFLPACRDEMERIYRRLHVTFDYTLGESFYQPMLATVVEDALAKGVAKMTEDAVGIFFTPEELVPPACDVPMLIRKKDGAFLYATTDLATIQYRVKEWNPDRILYLTDHRQGLHFQQLFAAVKKLGFPPMDLRHVSFGTVLGEDGKPFKTRSGDTVGLESLLDESVVRARAVIDASGSGGNNNGGDSDNADMTGNCGDVGDQKKEVAKTSLSNDDPATESEKANIAETVGIAALKYADLSQNRTSDYVFSYDKMLAMNGNTATYMQYAYARVRSIFRKTEVDIETLRQTPCSITLDTAAERSLALSLMQFETALEHAASDSMPHHLAGYLYDLAGAYSSFFEKCPVLKAESVAQRNSRLLLCDLVARTIAKGLELLGIEVVERM